MGSNQRRRGLGEGMESRVEISQRGGVWKGVEPPKGARVRVEMETSGAWGGVP